MAPMFFYPSSFSPCLFLLLGVQFLTFQHLQIYCLIKVLMPTSPESDPQVLWTLMILSFSDLVHQL